MRRTKQAEAAQVATKRQPARKRATCTHKSETPTAATVGGSEDTQPSNPMVAHLSDEELRWEERKIAWGVKDDCWDFANLLIDRELEPLWKQFKNEADNHDKMVLIAALRRWLGYPDHEQPLAFITAFVRLLEVDGVCTSKAMERANGHQ